MQTNSSHHHFSDEQLLEIFAKSKDATAIYTGEQFYIQFANERLIRLFGKGPEIIGQPLLEVVPELKEHDYVQLLHTVWESGEARNVENVPMRVDGMRTPVFFDLVYFPVLDKAGKTYCILQTSIEITEAVQRRRQVAQREKDLLAFDSSPVPMLIFRGDQFVFEEINPVMLQLLGKDGSIKGKPLMEIMPELKGQPILHVIYDTFRKGKEHRAKEERVRFIRDGKLFQGYYNVTYTPLWENGVVTGILQSAEDVTEAVIARQKIQQAEERLRLAVEAAQMGTFSVHTQTLAMQGSDRFRELFGFSPEEVLSYDGCMQQIRDDFRPDVINKLNGVMKTGEMIEMEFPVMNHQDGATRWLRGGGTLQRDHQGNGGYFTGIVIEIDQTI